MFREIRKKLVILGNRKPFKKETIELAIELQKKNWLAMNMRLEGRQISDKVIENILDENIPNVPVQDVIFLRDLEWLFDKMILWRESDYRLTKAMLEQMYKVISGQEEAEYRKTAFPILEWGYTLKPMSNLDISRELDAVAMLEYERVFDNVSQAIRIHNGILRVCPFKDFNQVIARAAMVYYLMSREMPLASFELKEEEYNEILSKELKQPKIIKKSQSGRKYDEDEIEVSELYEPLAKGILGTLNLIDNLTSVY